ncbi:MAG: hypothetical protein L6V86_08895 [Treponema sp.]|nr:MAG: hypothetical protein L6V86_08895 [Treponema sp.]
MIEFSDFIKHQANAEYFGNWIISEFKELYREKYDEILNEINSIPLISSKEKLLILQECIEAAYLDLEKKAEKKLDEDIEQIIETEKSWLVSYMAKIGILYTVSNSLAKNVKFMPIAEKNSYKEIIPQMNSRIKRATENVLKIAYLTKEPSENITERLERNYKRYENYIETDLMTMNSAIFRNTDYQIFRENNQTVRYSAILDFHTCLNCASNSGIIYKITEAPILPMHERCRCFLCR